MKLLHFFILALIGSKMLAQVGIGTVTPNSTLDINGSISTKTDVVSGFPVTLDINYHTIFTDDVVNLPDPSNIIGREYIIKTDATGAVINAQVGDQIDGSSSLNLNPFESVMVKAAAAGQWFITGGKFAGVEEINDLSDGKTLNNSVYLGNSAGLGANGSRNVSIGDGSLLNADGNDNIGIGHAAGSTIDTGNKNIVIGFEASSTVSSGITTGSNNILIGDQVNTSGVTVSNELNIGNAIYATSLYGSSTQVGVGNGNNAPNSTLSVSGSMSLPIRTGGDITLTDNDYTYIWVNASPGTVTLPLANGRTGRIYVIKNVNTAVNLTLSPSGSDQIDGAASQTIAGGNSLIVQSNGGTEWWIISSY